jgi:hypothetical protein
MKKQRSVLLIVALFFSTIMLSAQTAYEADSAELKLNFSTYLSHTDKYASGFDIYSDKDGNTYVCGNTRDKNFPATENAYQTKLCGSADVFVVKYSPAGEIIFATLLGGSNREHHSAITVDEQGFIFVAGGTESEDFPVTEGTFDESFNGKGSWAGDIFVTKLTPDGSNIVFSTYIGGEVEETLSGGCIKVDSKGNVIIGGLTKSKDFPLTKGQISDSESMHGFIAKFSPKGEKLLFSYTFGSSTWEIVTGVEVDDKDNIYLTGATFSENLPVTDDALRKEIIMPKSGGINDHYLVKIDGISDDIVYFSYFITEGFAVTPLKWTKPDRLVVCGSTETKNFPATSTLLSDTIQGMQDCYLALFNSETMHLEYASIFGGSEMERVTSTGFINAYTIVVGGTTSSPDFPITDNALYPNFPTCEKTFNSSFLGRKKCFVSIIDTRHNEILNSTFMGSGFLFNIYPDINGNISFVAEAGQRGEAGDTGFPITKNAEEPPTYTMIGRLLLNVPPEPTKEELYKDVTVNSDILKSYVAKYELSPGFAFTITFDDGQLVLHIPEQGNAPLFPMSESAFFLKTSNYEFSFNMNSDGEVVSMTMHPDGGDDVICKKIEE